MAFKMNPRSPLMKQLKGGQKNLPQALKSAIEAAPESPAKMKASPMKVDSATIPYKGATKTSQPMGPPEAPKAKPKYDKELNTLVASRKGLKKGTAEYNTIQNKINAKLGSKKVHGRGTSTETKLATKTAKVEAPKVKAPKLAPTISAPKPTPKVAAKAPKEDSTKIKQTAAGTKRVSKTGGGANQGGTTTKQKVTKNKEKTVIKDKDTRTVIKRSDKGARITETKTTKRLGKGRIKEALANRKEARNNKKALKQTKKANVSVDGTPNKPQGKSMVNATSPAKKGYDGVATGGSKPKPKATPGQRKAIKAFIKTASKSKPAPKAVKVQATPKPKASKEAMAQIKVITDKIAAKSPAKKKK